MYSRRGFSLVELLVVTAVVALLVSIMLPSLSSARRQAEAVVCGSNLRQLAVANMMYADAHGGRFCPGAPNFRVRNLMRWHGARPAVNRPFEPEDGPLQPFLGFDEGIRACAALQREIPPGGARGFERNAGGFGYNQAFLGVELERVGGGWRQVSDLLGAQSEQVARPHETLMFADTAFMEGELVEYSFAEPRFFPTWGNRADPSLHFRHPGRSANVAWTDGHVDRRQRTFTWSSGLYRGDADAADLGWFGHEDSNRFFDLD